VKIKHLIPVVLLIISACDSQKDFQKEAEEIHKEILTIDSHTDTPLQLMSHDINLGEYNHPDSTYSKVDFVRMKQGGLDAAFFAIFIGQSDRDSAGNALAIDRTFEIYAAVTHMLNENNAFAKRAVTIEDAIELKKEGKNAIFLGIENGYALGDSLELLETYYNMGIRYLTLAHTKNNDICDSSTDSTEHGGLSEFGVQVIDEMNRLGMMVDVSHISDNAFFDVLEQSSVPVIASHSNARAVCDNPRNLTDDMLRAIADKNGVVQVCVLSTYVKPPEEQPLRDSAKNAVRQKHGDYYGLDDEGKKAFLKDWYAVDNDFPAKLATVSDLVDHIDHIVKVAGIDHVGIGTDFDGGGALADCYDASELKNITIELLKRGYSKEDIEKIWSGNLARVFKDVQQQRQKSS